ncbi:hypothetical protein QVA66_00560 [Staphylococcus chromogenes]|nr:hypothetical protein [Staphylococcus chromogenes]
MVPEDVDMNALRADLAADNVAVYELGKQYPHLEPQLIDVSRHAETTGFGKTGIVVLDRTPQMPTDVRDIAQELLDTTGYDAIILRTPGTGSVVSRHHSRAELESAQWHFLDEPDIAAGARELIDRCNEHFFPWAGINMVIGGLIVLAIALAALGYLRQTRMHSTHKVSV